MIKVSKEKVIQLAEKLEEKKASEPDEVSTNIKWTSLRAGIVIDDMKKQNEWKKADHGNL